MPSILTKTISVVGFTLLLLGVRWPSANSKLSLRRVAILNPFPPVGGPHIDGDAGDCMFPAGSGTPAWEDERVLAIFVDDGQLQQTKEWCGKDRLPHDRVAALCADLASL